jgi:thiamine pyrophosphate-dependent acetolactate synthase large subunit-like protein
VLHNNDLNQVTWEMRGMEGAPKFTESQRLPDVSYEGFARSLGLNGIAVDKLRPGKSCPARTAEAQPPSGRDSVTAHSGMVSAGAAAVTRVRSENRRTSARTDAWFPCGLSR